MTKKTVTHKSEIEIVELVIPDAMDVDYLVKCAAIKKFIDAAGVLGLYMLDIGDNFVTFDFNVKSVEYKECSLGGDFRDACAVVEVTTIITLGE